MNDDREVFWTRMVVAALSNPAVTDGPAAHVAERAADLADCALVEFDARFRRDSSSDQGDPEEAQADLPDQELP